jgi:hypothetical protein
MSEQVVSPADFEAALCRIERGLATVEDAGLIRRYVAEMDEVIKYYANRLADTREMLRRERESSNRFQRALNQALNEGSGVYIP